MERSSQLSLGRFSSDSGCEVSSGDPFHHYVRENKDRMLSLIFRGTSTDHILGCKIHCRSWKRQIMEATVTAWRSKMQRQ